LASKAQVGEVPIVYAPRTRASVLPVREAAAVVLLNEKAQVLTVRRSEALEQFPGSWSFPSVYRRPGQALFESLRSGLEEWLAIDIEEARLIARRMGLRADHRILMHLFETRLAGEPRLVSSKYAAWRWVDGRAFVEGIPDSAMGECTKAYRHFLAASQAPR
jgi:hypothetical protein